MKLGAALASVIVAAAFSACAEHEPVTSHGALGGGSVARVGDVSIQASLVAEVAKARGVTPRVALDALIADAIAAQGASSRKLDERPPTSWSLRTTLARIATDRIRDAAIAQGPPTDAEIAEASAVFWREVDCPEKIRVLHVIALNAKTLKKKDESIDERARAFMTAARPQLADAKSADDFEAKAKALSHEGVEVLVQSLPLFVADGRAAEGPPDAPSMVLPFATAAFKLAPGQVSDVVETQFGWHVIYAIERIPPVVLPIEDRRARFADDAIRVRAKRDVDGRLQALKKATKVEVSPAAEALMAEATPH